MPNLEKLLKEGKYEKILEIFANKEPNDPKEYNILGISYFSLGKINKSIITFKKMLQKFPGNLDALFNLAEIYRQLEKWNKAKEFASEYLKKDPRNWAMLDIISDVFTFEGNFEEAIKYLEKAIRFSPAGIKEKLKEKLDNIILRYRYAERQEKIAFICAYGLDNFIDDIIKNLSNDYWVRKFPVKSSQEIYRAIDWADIVWFEWANEVSIIGTNYSEVEKKKVILRLHSYESFRKDFLEKINWNVVDDIIFVAKYIIEIATSYQPLLMNKRKHLIPNGINLSRYKYRKRKPGFKIAFLGNFNYIKNPMMTVQILKKLVDIDKRYIFYWAGNIQDERIWRYINHILEDMKIKTHFVFEGWIDDVDEWLDDKNIFLSTSIHESFLMAIIEAMAKGIKPVIHNFRAAKEFYPKHLIFNTIDEAVEMIISKEYDSEEYKNLAEKHSLNKQLEKIKKVIA